MGGQQVSRGIPSVEMPDSDVSVTADEREYDIGVANRENVQRLLSSAALYPLTELLG